MNDEFKDAFAGVIAEHYVKSCIARHFGLPVSMILHNVGSSKDKNLKIDFQLFTDPHGDMMVDLKSSTSYETSISINKDHPIFKLTSIAHGDRWIGCLFPKSSTLYLVKSSRELEHIAILKGAFRVVHESDVKRLPKTLVEEINIDVPFGKFFETTFGKDKPWTRCKTKDEAIDLAKAFGEQMCSDIPS